MSIEKPQAAAHGGIEYSWVMMAGLTLVMASFKSHSYVPEYP